MGLRAQREPGGDAADTNGVTQALRVRQRLAMKPKSSICEQLSYLPEKPQSEKKCLNDVVKSTSRWASSPVNQIGVIILMLLKADNGVCIPYGDIEQNIMKENSLQKRKNLIHVCSKISLFTIFV